ncbi:MAG: glutathione S-transferase family protein [Luteimonas sp.]
MILIGMFDSPFVRRVAISLTLLGHAFEHRNWSVGKDFDRIREHNPLGRVPVLVLDDGTALVESAMILDFIDDQASAERALLPAHGAARLDALRIMAMATGAVEKGLQQVMERVFRPDDKRHPPWVERCRQQMHGALVELDRVCAEAGDRDWLVGSRMTQVDITLGCFVTYVHEAVPAPLEALPALQARVARYEALEVFRRFHVPFDIPIATTIAPA